MVEPFDKRHNVVVGRNGSGKSNFFHGKLRSFNVYQVRVMPDAPLVHSVVARDSFHPVAAI